MSRQHQLLPGAQNGPMNAPFGMVAIYPGYLAIVFIHDNRTFSTLIARASTDRQMAALRFQEVYEAASRAIPSLAAWTEPDRSRPAKPVAPGAGGQERLCSDTGHPGDRQRQLEAAAVGCD